MIRHGESTGNPDKKVQGHDAKLTETGRKQAEAVAKRLKNSKIEAVISSTAERAIKTAGEIAAILGKKHISEPIFLERMHPTRFIGMSRLSKEFLEYEKLRNKMFTDPNWRYEDGENFYDVKERAFKAMKYLENLKYEHVAVVSHGIFMREFLCVVLFGDKYTYDLYDGTMKIHTMNTGITVFNVEKIGNSKKWSLKTWNDYTHLPS